MRSWMTYLLPLFLVTASGCAHVAKISMWSPTAAPIDGVKTVVVLPFEGEWGNRVAEEVSDAFSESGTYTIVGAASLPTIQVVSSGAEAPEFDQLLVDARRADIDAVLTGTIVAEESSTRRPPSRFGFSRKTSQTQNEMTVEYRLIDTRTGETLSQNRISCLEPESKTSAENLQEVLIQRCGLEVVSQLTPRSGECSITLANCPWSQRGSLSVRQGVRSAEQGDWGAAVISWEAALRANPENDAALFNLALAAASESDFKKAEELALEAIRIQHSDCYETGLEQIRQQRSQSEIAPQRHGDIKLSSNSKY
jgi:Curli production assembly/transport component CsgG